MSLPFPLRGSTLITGRSNVGKTRLTAKALDAWTDKNGPRGTVVLDFAPEFERNGRILGGRLTRFTTVPDEAFHGVLDAHAPRTESATLDGAIALARDNASRAARLFESLPTDPQALFVNDATIPFQHESGDLDAFLSYADPTEVAVLNAFESDELGTDDQVSRRERSALDQLHDWADRSFLLE